MYYIREPLSASICARTQLKPFRTKKDGYPSPRHYELVIPLVADGAFFELLSDALRALSEYLTGVRSNFSVTLRDLAATISSSARPMSATSSFRPYSVVSSDPSASLSPPNLFRHAKVSGLPVPM